MAWTNEMIDGLRKMWQQGLTTNEIAKNLGVSKNSIVGKVHRLNLTARPSPIKKKEGGPKDTKKTKETETSKPKTKSVKKVTINPVEIKPETVEQQTPNTGACLKLSELDGHSCRWPLGDPRDDNFCFCGKKVRGGQTYCEEHSAIAYVKPNKKG